MLIMNKEVDLASFYISVPKYAWIDGEKSRSAFSQRLHSRMMELRKHEANLTQLLMLNEILV
jgi:ribosomal protein S10